MQVMLYQEYDTYLDDEWLTSNERLKSFRKYIGQIVGSIKGEDSPYVQGTKYSEEDLVIRERFPIRTEGLSVREAVTDGNH